jgi:predicted Zn-dependent peptidase
VLEEYKMYDDSPDDLSVDTFLQNLWPSHPLGRPVIGFKGTIRKFSRESAGNYWRREFRPDRLLISIAGSFDAKACAKVIKERFAPLEAPASLGPRPRPEIREAPPKQTYRRRPIEQAYFCLGTDGPDRCSPDRFPFGLMNMVLGGGMSSRLFQEIREKRGLAYSIGSFAQLFSDRGFLAVSGGTSFITLAEVIKITMDEIQRICEEEVSEQELFLAREQIIDAMLLGMENTEARMSRLAESVLAFGRIVPVDEVIQHVKQVEISQMRRVARKYFRSRPFAVSFIGPKEGQLPVKGRVGLNLDPAAEDR